jgi:hypothetical protein
MSRGTEIKHTNFRSYLGDVNVLECQVCPARQSCGSEYPYNFSLMRNVATAVSQHAPLHFCLNPTISTLHSREVGWGHPGKTES